MQHTYQGDQNRPIQATLQIMYVCMSWTHLSYRKFLYRHIFPFKYLFETSCLHFSFIQIAKGYQNSKLFLYLIRFSFPFFQSHRKQKLISADMYFFFQNFKFICLLLIFISILSSSFAKCKEKSGIPFLGWTLCLFSQKPVVNRGKPRHFLKNL